MGKRLGALVIREPQTFGARLDQRVFWHTFTSEHLLNVVYEDRAARLEREHMRDGRFE